VGVDIGGDDRSHQNFGKCRPGRPVNDLYIEVHPEAIVMIECRYILSLCDLFEDYLMPLDIHILRQRYNGKVLKSTYTVAKEMGLSDETVRTIENRALEALAHCLRLQANDQEIEPLRLAKAIQAAGGQPGLPRPVALGVVRWLHRAPGRAADLLAAEADGAARVREAPAREAILYRAHDRLPVWCHRRPRAAGQVLQAACAHQAPSSMDTAIRVAGNLPPAHPVYRLS
jgi:hypothetical protein